MDTGSYLAVIKVVGVGGGGTNAVNRMVDAGPQGRRVHRGEHGRPGAADDATPTSSFRSAGSSRAASARAPTPTWGMAAANESRDEIKEALKGADMVFVTAGEGGGTGTGAAPVIAEIAKHEVGALTVGVVTRPFMFEGSQRSAPGRGRHPAPAASRWTR